MFCSTIIPTIGRDTLSKSVYSVLNQTFTNADFEVIVINDSGKPLPEESWQQSERVQVLQTHRRERSVARNVGAAIAKGLYLHFLDDDDWLQPNAFESIWELAQNNQAGWLYGAYNFTDNAGNILEEWHPDEEGNCLVRLIASEWLPLQASFIKSEVFFKLGGFDPAAVPFEDSNLGMRLALHCNIAGTTALVVNIDRSENGSTTDYSLLQSKTRWSREQTLSQPASFLRLRSSAVSRPINSPYWQGRITAAYLSSVTWNLRRRKFLTALSRGIYSIGNVALAGRRLGSLSFWRGVTKPHTTRGFLCRYGIE